MDLASKFMAQYAFLNLIFPNASIFFYSVHTFLLTPASSYLSLFILTFSIQLLSLTSPQQSCRGLNGMNVYY